MYSCIAIQVHVWQSWVEEILCDSVLVYHAKSAVINFSLSTGLILVSVPEGKGRGSGTVTRFMHSRHQICYCNQILNQWFLSA